jgi:hypothetical protein
MKFNVDTDKKEITFIEENLTLGEIVEFMSEMFGVEWGKYKVYLVSKTKEKANKIQEELEKGLKKDIKTPPITPMTPFENPAKWIYDPNDPPIRFIRDTTGNVEFIN